MKCLDCPYKGAVPECGCCPLCYPSGIEALESLEFLFGYDSDDEESNKQVR